MRKFILFICVLNVFAFINAQPQKNHNNLRITYQSGFNNKKDSSSFVILEIEGDLARIRYESSRMQKDDPVQMIYLDYNTKTETKTALLDGGELIYTTREFKIGDNLEAQPETDKIAGYNCEKAKTVINSNTIEIWYTKDLGLRGTMQPGVGIPDGVVLKVVRNGQSSLEATKVEFPDDNFDLNPDLSGQKLTAPAFNYRIQQSKVIAVNVFDRESIFFRDIPKPTELSDTEVMRFANGSILLRKVRLPEDNTDYSIFAELSQYSEGDAYDRTGSIFVVPVDKKRSFMDGLLKGKEQLPQYADKHGDSYEGMTVTEDYDPALELMRFYTSFGVRGYNHIEVAQFNWPDSVIYKQEVTDYAQMLKGEVWVGAWIGNYSHNGHNVTLDIKYYPKGKDDARKEIYPLFTTVNILEMAGQAYPEGMFRNDSLSVTFKTDTDLKDAYIRYISTGHGGWGGGDEFNPKMNEIFLDNNRLMAYTPWREDCGSYRELNPASGNFANGLSSSDLSRSGWCPGLVSFPVFIHVGDLKAGEHNLKVAIPVGDPAGSSRSYWCISGVLVGNKIR